MKKLIFLLLFALSPELSADAQTWSLGTNVATWADLGTLNIEGSAAVARHFTLVASVAYNPWLFRSDDPARQFQDKRREAELGFRWWHWHVYSGWWLGTSAQFREYNRGGLRRRDTEEGNAWGLGVSAGYTLMLHKSLNVEFGAGLRTGYKNYTCYSCPRCGRITDEGSKWFVAPDDLTLSLIWVF